MSVDGIERKIKGLQRNKGAMLKLLGDNPIRWWETTNGVTTPAEFRLLESALDNASMSLKTATQQFEIAQVAVQEMRR